MTTLRPCALELALFSLLSLRQRSLVLVLQSALAVIARIAPGLARSRARHCSVHHAVLGAGAGVHVLKRQDLTGFVAPTPNAACHLSCRSTWMITWPTVKGSAH